MSKLVLVLALVALVAAPGPASAAPHAPSGPSCQDAVCVIEQQVFFLLSELTPFICAESQVCR